MCFLEWGRDTRAELLAQESVEVGSGQIYMGCIWHGGAINADVGYFQVL